MDFNFIRPFQRGRAIRRPNFRESSDEESVEETVHLVFEGPAPSRTFVSQRDLSSAWAKSAVDARVLNAVVLEYLVTEGLLEEAGVFAEEAGLDLRQSLNTKFAEFRIGLKRDFFSGAIDLLIDKLTEFSPTFWINCPFLLLEVRAIQLGGILQHQPAQVEAFVRTKMLPVTVSTPPKPPNDAIRVFCEELVARAFLNPESPESLDATWEKIDSEISRSFPEQTQTGIQALLNVLFNLQNAMRSWCELPQLPEDDLLQVARWLANKGSYPR